MANITPFTSSWFMAAGILLLSLTACNPKTEYYLIKEESKMWFPGDTTGFTFRMIDANQISRWYRMQSMVQSFSHGSSSYFGIKEYSEREELTYTYENNLRISISASYDGYDELHVNLERFYFQYNLQDGKLRYIGSGDYFKSSNIKSTAEKFEELLIGDYLYKDVLHVSQKDFPDISKYSITDFYYVKGIGVVKYCLKDGPEYIRK